MPKITRAGRELWIKFFMARVYRYGHLFVHGGGNNGLEIVSLKGVINLLKLYRQVMEYKVYELSIAIRKNYMNKGRPTLSQRAPFLGLLPMSEFGRILVF
jgi:hypothetical protein